METFGLAPANTSTTANNRRRDQENDNPGFYHDFQQEIVTNEIDNFSDVFQPGPPPPVNRAGRPPPLTAASPSPPPRLARQPYPYPAPPPPRYAEPLSYMNPLDKHHAEADVEVFQPPRTAGKVVAPSVAGPFETPRSLLRPPPPVPEDFFPGRPHQLGGEEPPSRPTYQEEENDEPIYGKLVSNPGLRAEEFGPRQDSVGGEGFFEIPKALKAKIPDRSYAAQTASVDGFQPRSPSAAVSGLSGPQRGPSGVAAPHGQVSVGESGLLMIKYYVQPPLQPSQTVP
jgi:hypothetical protein